MTDFLSIYFPFHKLVDELPKPYVGLKYKFLVISNTSDILLISKQCIFHGMSLKESCYLGFSKTDVCFPLIKTWFLCLMIMSLSNDLSFGLTTACILIHYISFT